MSVVTLLTDFGTRDYYVGAVKGVLLSLAPEARIVDIGHQIAPGDIDEGSFLLAAASSHFPAGTVHLAVVDPGVGSSRRILAARCSSQLYVAPDNGLLTPLLDGARVHSVERTELYRSAPGETFHGRDRMAPVAAYLARGEPLSSLGPEITDPVRRPWLPPRQTPSGLYGRVRHVDRFGNLVTDLPNEWFQGQRFSVDLGGLHAKRWVTHYDELPPGEAGLLAGSLGTLELSLRGESLAGRCGRGTGTVIAVLFQGD